MTVKEKLKDMVKRIKEEITSVEIKREIEVVGTVRRSEEEMDRQELLTMVILYKVNEISKKLTTIESKIPTKDDLAEVTQPLDRIEQKLTEMIYT